MCLSFLKSMVNLEELDKSPRFQQEAERLRKRWNELAEAQPAPFLPTPPAPTELPPPDNFDLPEDDLARAAEEAERLAESLKAKPASEKPQPSLWREVCRMWWKRRFGWLRPRH